MFASIVLGKFCIALSTALSLLSVSPNFLVRPKNAFDADVLALSELCASLFKDFLIRSASYCKPSLRCTRFCAENWSADTPALVAAVLVLASIVSRTPTL